ncbi:hypothetical protein WJT74_00715 [Sphingomicrobium sp. XHP0239]|uniref:EF-hand domain-containing protein n=1 Tax=Sphingomicrobium maritimum TaxID=3133972 RepID=UPI0031CC582E
MKKMTLMLAATALAIPAAAAAQPNNRAPQGDVTLEQMQQRSAERFQRLDRNGDGQVSKAEMEAQREARRDARFARMDTNNDGALTQAELEAARDQRQQMRGERRGDRAERRGQRGMRGMRMGRGGGFDRLDANGNGSITLAEFQAPQVERFQRIDTDNDGTLTQAERQAAREQMRANRQNRRANR